MESSKLGCPACQEWSEVEWGEDRGVKIFRCATCDTIYFFRPIAHINDYGDYYPYLSGFSSERAAQELEVRVSQANAKLNVMATRLGSRPLRILDIGSGPGYFAALANRAGHDAVCSELNQDAVAFGEKHFGVEFVDVYDSAMGDFDVVTFFHVVEHLDQPSNLVARGVQHLRPGGLLYLHVPLGVTASNILETGLKRLIRPTYDRRGCLYLPDHLTGFSKVGLERFVRRLGLNEVEVGKVHMFSPEFDPLFLKFRPRTLGSLASLGVELTRGLVDYCVGGTWLRLTARKS